MVTPLLKKEQLVSFLLVVLFALFPFGQLLRVESTLIGLPIRFNLLDIAFGLFVIPFTLRFTKKTKVSKAYLNLLLVLGLTWLVAFFILGYKTVIGLLYLFRLTSFYFFLVVVSQWVSKGRGKVKIIKIVEIALFVSALFGWFQYFVFYDLRPLYSVGWDDHLFRMTGTFLDPTFAGIVFVFGFLHFIFQFVKNKNKKDLLSALFFAATTLFTYSRASYVALVFGLLYLAFSAKKRLLVIVLVVFIFFIFLLPRPAGEGVKLERVYSVTSRFESYTKALVVGMANPLFGVGFNNYCLATDGNFKSHSCSASDASLLTVFATAGIVGLLGLLWFLKEIILVTGWRSETSVVVVALLVHSLFSNSLFYPWVIVLFFGVLARDLLKK